MGVERGGGQGRRHRFLSEGSNRRQGGQATPKYPKNRKTSDFGHSFSNLGGRPHRFSKVRGSRPPRPRRLWGDASPRSEKLEGDVTQDSENEVAQIHCLFRFLWYFRDSRGVVTDFFVGGTNRRQVANLLQNTLKSEKAPDLGHFILESGGGRPLLN